MRGPRLAPRASAPPRASAASRGRLGRRASSTSRARRATAAARVARGEGVDAKPLSSAAERYADDVLATAAAEGARREDDDVAERRARVEALTRDVDALTSALDGAYRDAFGTMKLRVDGEDGEERALGDEAGTEIGFRELNAREPKAAAALLREAEKDGAKWLTFQKSVHSIKARRDRARDALAEAENALAVAKRGGVGFLSAPPMKASAVPETREGRAEDCFVEWIREF